MKPCSFFQFLLANVIVASFIGSSFAQSSTEALSNPVLKSAQSKQLLDSEEKIKAENVILGVIANSSGLDRSGAVDIETGDAVPGDPGSVISGGVFNKEGQCSVFLKNKSKENSYRVRFEVLCTNKRAREEMRQAFSGKIAAGETLKKTFPCKPDHDMQLELKSAVKR